jgi:hypothetical protein
MLDQARVERGSLLTVIKGVLDGDLISGGEGSEAVDALEGAEGGGIEGRGAAFVEDMDVGGGAVALDVEDDGDALALGGVRVGFVGVPVLRDFLRDDLDVVGVAIAEGAVLNGGCGGAVF